MSPRHVEEASSDPGHLSPILPARLYRELLAEAAVLLDGRTGPWQPFRPSQIRGIQNEKRSETEVSLLFSISFFFDQTSELTSRDFDLRFFHQVARATLEPTNPEIKEAGSGTLLGLSVGKLPDVVVGATQSVGRAGA